MFLVSILLPILSLVLFGFVLAKNSVIPQAWIDQLARATFNLLIPLYLFYSIVNLNLNAQLSIDVFAVFYGSVFSCFVISFFIFKSRTKMSEVSVPIASLSATYSNTIIVGLPILVSILSPSVAGIVFVVICVHSAILFGVTQLLCRQAMTSARFNLGRFILASLTNPLVTAIYIGLLFNLFDIELFAWLESTLALATLPALPLALVILGMTLVQYRVTGNKMTVAIGTAIKLFILPAITYIFSVYLFALSHELVTILVILTASPTGVNAYLIAVSEQSGQRDSASIVVVSTLVSVVSLPFWLLILGF